MGINSDYFLGTTGSSGGGGGGGSNSDDTNTNTASISALQGRVNVLEGTAHTDIAPLTARVVTLEGEEHTDIAPLTARVGVLEDEEHTKIISGSSDSANQPTALDQIAIQRLGGQHYRSVASTSAATGFIWQAIGSIPASTNTRGVVELATSAEAVAGTDAVRAVTPAGLDDVVRINTVHIIDSENNTLTLPTALLQGAAAPSSSGFFYHYTSVADSTTTTGFAWQRAMGRTPTATLGGEIRLATPAEVLAGIQGNKAVTPNTLQRKINALPAVVTPPNASDTTRGLVELATNAEATTGTDTARAVTPAGLAARIATIPTSSGGTTSAATATAAGIVELATNAELVTGTDTTRAVTPAGLEYRRAPLLTSIAAAHTLATSANNAADNAQTTADTANTTAVLANTAAGNARTSALTANTAATNAQTDATANAAAILTKGTLTTGFTQADFAGALAANPIGISTYTHGGITDLDDFYRIYEVSTRQFSQIYDNDVSNSVSELSTEMLRHYHIKTTPISVLGVPVTLTPSATQTSSDTAVYIGALAGTTPYFSLSGRHRVRVSLSFRANNDNGILLELAKVRTGADDTILINAFNNTNSPAAKPDSTTSPGTTVKVLSVNLQTPITNFVSTDVYYITWRSSAESNLAGTRISTFIEIEKYN